MIKSSGGVEGVGGRRGREKEKGCMDCTYGSSCDRNQKRTLTGLVTVLFSLPPLLFLPFVLVVVRLNDARLDFSHWLAAP